MSSVEVGGMDAWDAEHARFVLRDASKELSRRGLKLAAKWASEQVLGLAGPPSPSQEAPKILEGEKALYDDEDVCTYAKSLFDLGEYLRAAAVLSCRTSGLLGDGGGIGEDASSRVAKGALVGDLAIHPPLPNLSPYGVYLRAYSLYLAGERRKEEEVTELRNPLERTAVVNAYLPQLAEELQSFYVANHLDSFGLYIFGVVLKELKTTPIPLRPAASEDVHHRIPEAHQVMIESILAFPYNWSAWLDLAQMALDDLQVNDEVEEGLAPLRGHWMFHFFLVHVYLEKQANEDAIAVIERLVQGVLLHSPDFSSRGMFVESPYLQTQLALAHYNTRDFDAAQAHFEALITREPHWLEKIDVYSNILFVKEDKVKLSQLAHRAVKVDKYRPETCCVVGNYYSLRSRHDKAVQYFQRALKLDPSFLSAWTLIGHEYIELRNPAAAVEAYRRAVDINPTGEFRGWYGLGQSYEILNMPLYAAMYYKKAAAIRPFDARMLSALGGCYLDLGRRTEAILCFERAIANGDTEGIATQKLGTLYREDGNVEKAARCYLRHLELRFVSAQGITLTDLRSGQYMLDAIVDGIQIGETEAEALLYLAYYHRDNLEFDIAFLCCTRLLEYPGPEKEESKALLREIRSRKDRRGAVRGVATRGMYASSRSPPQPANSASRTAGGEAGGGDDSMDLSRGESSSFDFSP